MPMKQLATEQVFVTPQVLLTLSEQRRRPGDQDLNRFDEVTAPFANEVRNTPSSQETALDSACEGGNRGTYCPSFILPSSLRRISALLGLF